MLSRLFLLLLFLLALAPGLPTFAQAESDSALADAPADAPADAMAGATAAPAPADDLVRALEPTGLRLVVREVLERNPDVSGAQARARAAALRAPQVKSLPDPTAQVTAFLESPETRVGPQQLGLSLMQPIPWLSKLSLRERASLLAASALEAKVEARRLELVTETRRLAYELAFLFRVRGITESFREHLLQHEEIARARYSTGVGRGQDVIKLQAEITKVETDLLGIDTREASLVAQVNRLRDRPATELLPIFTLPDDQEGELDLRRLFERSSRRRPEVAAADLEIRRAEALAELARKGYRPDFQVGLSLTQVDPREDAAGRLNPPEGNGDDILGLQLGVSVPIWRGRLKAGVEEASELRLAASESRREVLAGIEATIGDLVQRIPLGHSQLHLVEELLVVQAEEALESVTAAYVASTGDALDLLDAEHVLFNAQVAAARARADWAIAVARLEGAVGDTFSTLSTLGVQP